MEQLTIQELERQNNLLETYLGDDIDGSIFEKIKNNDKLIKNMKGGVNMNKTQLRSELSKVYGIKLSAEEFKNASVAELEAMVVNAKNNINNKVEGVVNMNNEKMVQVSEEELVARFRKALNIQAEVVAPVNTHTSEVGNNVMHHMDFKFSELEAKIDLLSKSFSTRSNNATTATKDYQKDATKLSSLGKTLNKAGKEVDFYGVCETCGTKILSPDVVAYSTKNLGKCTCYDCQKKAKRVTKADETKTDANATTPGVLHKDCPYCNAKVTYANSTALTNSFNKAKAVGIKPFACKKCATKVLAEKNEQQSDVAATVDKEESTNIIASENTDFVPETQIGMLGEVKDNVLLGDEVNQGF